MQIFEGLQTNASKAYSRGELHGDLLGDALADLQLPDENGFIITGEMPLGLLNPLAQTFAVAAGNALALHLVLNTTNQHLVLPQLRASLLERIASNGLDPLKDAPYTQYLSALTRAGELLTTRAGHFLTRAQATGIGVR